MSFIADSNVNLSRVKRQKHLAQATVTTSCSDCDTTDQTSNGLEQNFDIVHYCYGCECDTSSLCWYF